MANTKFLKQMAVALRNCNKLFVAFSGGLDSTVLLYFLTQLRSISSSKLKITAIHVNHNLSKNAKSWVKHCNAICKKWNVDLLVENVNAQKKDQVQSPEDIARKLRYEVFAKILPSKAFLMTAHHADDQAETLLLQLFRGAGPKGLAAMPKKTQFRKGWLIRPLLDFSRVELLQYAKEHKLKWVEDESNTNTMFSRNFIRHQVMPKIKSNWPGIITTLNRTARHCAEASELLESLAATDLSNVIGEVQNTLNILKYKKIEKARQRNVLRFWLRTLNLSIPSEVKIFEIERTIINSCDDANPVVNWQSVEIRRFQNLLYAMKPLTDHDARIIMPLVLNKKIKLPGIGSICVEISKNLRTRFKKEKLSVRFRQGGEVVTIPKRGTHKLKKLMQEWKISPWLRDRIPLIYCGEKIVAVVGYYSIAGMKVS